MPGNSVSGNAVNGNPVNGSGVGGAASGTEGVGGGSSQNCAIKAPEGYVPGRPRDQDIAPSTAPVAPMGQMAGSPLRPGEWVEPSPRMDPPPEPTNPKDREKERKRLEKVAKNHGYDWGLRDASAGSTSVSRSIRIDCYHDQLIFAPERGGRVIRFTGATDSALDELVAAIWTEMESWGMAGKRMYWRPILRVQVAPGGEQRFEDLQTLLQMSGLAVEKR